MFINGFILYVTLHHELKEFFRENCKDFTFSNIDADFDIATNMSHFDQCLC
jgi:hypothetical protein